MKPKKFDINFLCENGAWKMNEATKFPTEEDINITIESLEGLGVGKIKKIEIDFEKYQ